MLTVLHSLKASMRQKMFNDVVILGIVFIASFFLFSTFDVLEWIIKQAHQYEAYEIDELISASIILCILFAIFSFRRWQDVRKLSLYCEELSMIDPITLLPNRRVISRLLDEIDQGKNKQNCFPLSLILININGLECIQSTLGNNVAEQAIHELVYRYSLLLGPEQLISYRNASQCFIFCPKVDSPEAQVLCDKLHNVELEGRQATLQMLAIDAVFVTITRREQLDNVFERLEDLLHQTLAKQH